MTTSELLVIDFVIQMSQTRIQICGQLALSAVPIGKAPAALLRKTRHIATHMCVCTDKAVTTQSVTRRAHPPLSLPTTLASGRPVWVGSKGK